MHQAEANKIKTVILKPLISNHYEPILKLGDKWKLSFDDLNADETDYYYKIIHCDFNWKPSNLSASEYINGFDSDRIRNYENSFNTLQPYTHYEVTFPNEYTKLKISGNYIIKVLNEDDEVVFERRFVVYIPKVNISISIHKANTIKDSDQKQRIEFSINHSNLIINNPNQEIKTKIFQNFDWKFSSKNLKPLYFKGNQIIYKLSEDLSFWGSNEFLYFDTKNIRNTNLQIAKVELGEKLYHTYLYENEPRIKEPYTRFPDIDGNFIIRNLEGNDANTDADYNWVHFTLKMPKLNLKTVYVNGAFNNWQINDINKMKYNSELGVYEANILLKQGFYNYQYITKTNKNSYNNFEISGSHYQTENNYSVLVYYKKFGGRYTQVIGYNTITSIKLNN